MAVSSVTCVALYVGLRAYGSDRRWWTSAAWAVYALCVEGIAALVWANLVLRGEHPVPAGVWYALLGVVLCVPQIITLGIADAQNKQRRAVRPQSSWDSIPR